MDNRLPSGPLRLSPPAPTYFPTFGGGLSAFGLGITNTSFIAGLTRGQSQSLFHAELRSLDGQAAQLHVGDRYPVLTSGYYGDTSGSGTVYRPPPTVNFEDLGVVLKITPRVHGTQGVTLEVEAEFKTLSGQTSNDIPVISNRKFSMHAGLKFEETAVVAGVVQDTFTQSWSGLPLLVKIPGLQSNDRSSISNRLLLTLKPRPGQPWALLNSRATPFAAAQKVTPSRHSIDTPVGNAVGL